MGRKATTTHFDEYASFALVLTGAKTFHIAPPSLVHQTGRGMEHESSATPYKVGTAREQEVPQPFVCVHIGAGCLLYLPPRWWHYVDSQPKTIMLCACACTRSFLHRCGCNQSGSQSVMQLLKSNDFCQGLVDQSISSAPLPMQEFGCSPTRHDILPLSCTLLKPKAP